MKYIGLLAGLVILFACSESERNNGDISNEDFELNFDTSEISSVTLDAH